MELFNSDLSTRVGLQVCVELIVLLYARFTVGADRYTGTEFLKVHADPIEGEHRQYGHLIPANVKPPSLSYETL